MKVWLLKPRDDIVGKNPWEPWYDKAFGYVVRAESEERARQFASESIGDETVDCIRYKCCNNPWLDATYSTCEELTNDGPEGMILEEFQAA